MRIVLICVASALACGHSEPVTPVRQRVDVAPAVVELREGHFAGAERAASAALAQDAHDATAAAVRAIAVYQQAGEQLAIAMTDLLEHPLSLYKFDVEAGRAELRTFIDRLDAVDRDLAIAAADPNFSLELCIACWEYDWNHDGKIDERDRQLFEIEVDDAGRDLPAGDPRRRPTFHFDRGDVDWARAMIAFQRAFGELLLAYRWSELFKPEARSDETRIVIPLIEPARVHRARELALAGLAFADRCRAEYLAETDDDREWVPNPRQHSHPVPLAVDDALYAQWAAITGDVRRLLASEDGISLREVVRAVDPPSARKLPDAYVDLGRMFREPTDIVLLDSHGPDTPATLERTLRGLLGHGYATSMRASPLVRRLSQMHDELDRGADTASHKLRYLLWLN